MKIAVKVQSEKEGHGQNDITERRGKERSVTLKIS